MVEGYRISASDLLQLLVSCPEFYSQIHNYIYQFPLTLTISLFFAVARKREFEEKQAKKQTKVSGGASG